MKVNLKTTNEAENAAATPNCHQRGQRTVNGIIGNTRRGIVVDKTLDPDSNNPVANKPVSTALAALAGQLANAEATYQTKEGRADYVSKTYGDSTYATITQLGGKQDKLTAGSNITIEGTTIAATLPENMALYGDLAATDGEFTGGGSGGGSVSPTLNLIDFENGEIRTSITEEEYNNLKNGLYNSVNYYTEVEYDTYLPSKLISVYDDSDESLTCIFSSIKITGTSETDISSTNIVYQLNIGQKDTSGNYPITIEKEIEIPFGSSSTGTTGPTNTIPYCEIENFNDGDHNQQGFVMPTEDVVLFTNGSDTSLIGCKNGTSYYCYEWKPQIEGKLKTYKQFVYKISKINIGFKIETVDISQELNYNLMFLPGYSSSDNGKVLSVVNGEAQWASASGGGGGSAASVQSINAYGEGGATTIEKGKIATDLTDVDLKVPFVLNIYEDKTLSGTPTRIVMTNKVGEIYLGNLDFINHYLVQMTKGTDGKYSYASNIVPSATGNTLFNKPILVPEDLVDPTPILPCTTADNGKVLSVVNGEAQWANAGGGGSTKIDLYQHNIILIENSNAEYLYIKHISSKQSEVTTIADLNTLLGTGTYTFGCSGEVKINNTWYNAVAIYWDGSYAKSLVMYNVPNEGEKTAALTIYTSVADTVTPME